MAVIGIDLGTTNSLVSVWQDGKAVLIPNSLGEFLTPSAVGVDEDDNLIVGKIAKERLISHSAHTTASFKCFMGTDKMISLGERRFSSAELSSFILRQLKKDAEIYLGEPVSEAVISVPAYFDDNGRNATKLAGELAGLKVERIINEPSAAALAYKINREEEAAFLVFDFGGGTLDISIVDMFDSVIDIIAVAGDNHLGGDDFNMAIALYFCNENKLEFSELPESVKAVLLKQSEQCKIALSTQKTAAIIVNADQKNYSLVLDNQKLLEITAPLFERIRKPLVKALNDADMSASEIDEVILVGGSSHMLLVRRYLENLFHRNIDVSISPDTAVAEGVAVAAGIKERREDIRDVVLTDICPFTLGIGLHNEAQEDNLRFFPMIERNSTLPSSYEHKFCTVCDNQTSIRISIAQGEKPYFKSNLFLGELEMEVPPAPRGQEAVNVRFTYDINGILQVDVQSLSTGLKKSKLIVNKNARLTDEELARRVSQLEKLKIHPRELDENKLLIARAESIYEQSLGADREYIETALNRFILILERQKPGKIRRAQKQFSDFLDSMEMGSMRNPFDFYDDSDDEEE